MRAFESLFSQLLLVSITTSSILIISGICNFSNKGITFDPNPIRSLNIITFFVGLFKLFIYFHFGEEVSKSFIRLKNKLEELCAINELSNDEWKHWIAIKDMEPQFDLTVFNVIKLRRVNFLVIASFVLQYSVIIIQTNN